VGGTSFLSTAKIKTVIEEMVQPFFDEHGFELVDVEYVKEGSNWFLRIYECGRISEFISEKLDESDPITEAYFLEVSSPGAERPLKKPQDVSKAIGKHVFVTTYEPVSGAKEFEGTLLSFDGEEVVIDMGKKKYTIPYAKVASARLAIVF
jgi:ribosome maturation factor RimP